MNRSILIKPRAYFLHNTVVIVNLYKLVIYNKVLENKHPIFFNNEETIKNRDKILNEACLFTKPK